MIKALESCMNQKVLWWLDCRECLVARRPVRRVLQPSEQEQARACTSGDCGVQDRKLMNRQFENLGRHENSSRTWVTFMIRKIIIRKRNKKCDHPYFCGFSLLSWRWRASGKQQFFYPCVSLLPSQGPAIE